MLEWAKWKYDLLNQLEEGSKGRGCKDTSMQHVVALMILPVRDPGKMETV